MRTRRTMVAQLGMAFTDDFGLPVNKARVVRRHVAEGEAVEAGQPLLDLKVEEVLVPSRRWRAISRIRELDRVPGKAPAILSAFGDRYEGGDGAVEPVEWVHFLRVTAAECGTLTQFARRDVFASGEAIAYLTCGGGRANSDRPYREFAAVATPLEMEPVGALDRSLEVSRREEAEGVFQRSGSNFLTFWNDPDAGDRVGIYMHGGCDINAIFAAAPMIRAWYDGVCSIVHHGSISDSRSDVLLYNLGHGDSIPLDRAREAISKLRLPSDVFEPKLFRPTFRAEGPAGVEEFPKSVIVLDIGPDLTRSLYRHRRYGFLVDPGGGWLNQPLHSFLGDLSVVKWFRSEFEPIGKLDVAESYANFARIFRILRSRFDVPILLLNVPELEPGSNVHNLQLARNPHSIRRREFNIALAEMSREFDVSIVDVDRIINRMGIRAQLDWNHVHPKVHVVIAREAVRIMRERGVFESSRVLRAAG